MEKAMHKSHGMGYEEYSRSHVNRLEVEKRREKTRKAVSKKQADRIRLAHNRIKREGDGCRSVLLHVLRSRLTLIKGKGKI